MKIRIKGNSLRYRLTRSEVERLAKNGQLEETTNFGDTQLTYAIKQTGNDALSASFEANTITLHLPDTMIQQLAYTDRVGFDNNNNGLYLLIEKDFMCLDTPAEDQTDNYPNPLMITQ